MAQCTPLTSSRLELVCDLGGGALLHPFLRRQDEVRALAALGPVTAPLTDRFRRWAWPVACHWGRDGSDPGRFNHPRGVAISSGGDLVVCDSGNSRIVVCRPDGTFVRQWGVHGRGRWGASPEQLQHPTAVAVSSTDEVVVADTSNHRIRVFGLDGTFVRGWGGREGEGPGQFSYPVGVGLHGDLVLVADGRNHRIQCFGLDGSFLRMWGSAGDAPGQFKNPRGVAVSSAGEVFVCDSGNSRVQVFDLGGAFQRCWDIQGNPSDLLHHPRGVAVSSAGEVLVGQTARVSVFLTDGTFLRCLHLPADPPELFRPTDVAVTPAGDVVVSNGPIYCISVFPAGS